MRPPENEQIRRDFRRVLDQQADIGAAKIISSFLFERSNIFDSNRRRKLKPEILIVLTYVLLISAVCAAFNLR
jgi:hypothetical protein